MSDPIADIEAQVSAIKRAIEEGIKQHDALTLAHESTIASVVGVLKEIDAITTEPRVRVLARGLIVVLTYDDRTRH